MIIDLGAWCFGVVVGWITSRTLRRTTPGGLSDISTVIGSIAGAAITGIYKPSTNSFGYYCIGLFVGFFAYLLISVYIAKKEGNQAVGDWLGSEPVVSSGGGSSSSNGNPNVTPPA
jgi:uncharacterized membrane protein YeaQ/YmgE (transglycosylase-associated protein family)